MKSPRQKIPPHDVPRMRQILHIIPKILLAIYLELNSGNGLTRARLSKGEEFHVCEGNREFSSLASVVLGERLELSHPKVLAPKASASAISPSEHAWILSDQTLSWQGVDKNIK